MSSAFVVEGVSYVGATPRVDLLPKEVRQAAEVKATRRSILLIIVLALVVVVAGFAVVQLMAASSAADLAAANAETKSLVDQQTKYSKTRELQNAVTEADALHRVSTATQVDWDSILADALNALPAGMGYSNIAVTAQSPVGDPAQTTNPFGQASIGTIVIQLGASSIDQITGWLAAMRVDPNFAYVSALQTQNNDGSWSIGATLYISPSVTALSTSAPTDSATTSGGNG